MKSQKLKNLNLKGDSKSAGLINTLAWSVVVCGDVMCRRVELSCVKGVKMCQLLQATERLARPFHREPKALPRRARVQRRGA